MEDKLIQDVHDIKNTLTKFGVRLELIYNALNGNELSKDGGLIADILEQKSQIRELAKRVDIVETKENNRRLYVKIIWAALAVIVTIVIQHFLK